MIKLALSLILLMPLAASAQTYTEDMQDWRDGYKSSLLTGSHPLKPKDTAFLRFYPIDPDYKANAVFIPVLGAKPFLPENMHGGTQKAVREYGYVYFNLLGASLKLYIYEFLGAGNAAQSQVRLFIPFTDRTNYKETFGGGRYLDVSIDDIKDNKVVLDFNKCYNPHTAYQKGYPYIIPPKANGLRIEIRAGEKIYGNDPGY